MFVLYRKLHLSAFFDITEFVVPDVYFISVLIPIS